MDNNPKNETKGAKKKPINFIEKNKQLAAAAKQKKLNSKPIEFKEKESFSESKENIAELQRRPKTAIPPIQTKRDPGFKRPATAPQQGRNGTVTGKKGFIRNGPSSRRIIEDDRDIVSKMAGKNLHHLLSGIFLSLNTKDLTACRHVCTAWYRYFKQVFWRDKVVRWDLENRLRGRWENKECRQVSVLVSGQSCKLNCAQNFRDCHCKEKLQCAVSGNSLVVDFGGNFYLGQYRDNRESWHRFEVEQFQVSLHLKLDLRLEINTWLSTPVVVKERLAKRKQEFEGLTVEVSPGDPTYLLVKDKETQEVKSRVQPYTGWSFKKPVDDLMVSSGRLAVLMGGKVFVYCLEGLARGAGARSLLLKANDSRGGEPKVHFFHLKENMLVTVGGCRVTTHDFWIFDWNTNQKDFVT